MIPGKQVKSIMNDDATKPVKCNGTESRNNTDHAGKNYPAPDGSQPRPATLQLALHASQVCLHVSRKASIRINAR